ncbi:MAG: hypothetical protein EA344_08530 [Alkalicoccus sp.]|nr:MAG: hypothetical protein EA344_08530 [Alkalicoccus sp.]
MNHAWMVGPVLVQLNMIFAVAAFAAAFVLLRYFSPLREDLPVRDGVQNAFLWGLAALIFSTAFFQIPLLFRDPLVVLSYPSGSREAAVSVIVVLTAVLYDMRKKGTSAASLTCGIAFVLFSADIVYTFFTQPAGMDISWLPVQHPAALYSMGVSFIGLVMLFRIKQSRWGCYILAGWMLSQFLISLAERLPHFFLVTVQPGFYFFAGICVLGFGTIMNRIQKQA